MKLSNNLIVAAIVIIIGMFFNMFYMDAIVRFAQGNERIPMTCMMIWTGIIGFYVTYLPIQAFTNKGTA